MGVTLDDKATVRAYCIKEDFIIRDDRVFQAKQKLQRLLSEGNRVNLVPPSQMGEEELIAIVKKMV